MGGGGVWGGMGGGNQGFSHHFPELVSRALLGIGGTLLRGMSSTNWKIVLDLRS